MFPALEAFAEDTRVRHLTFRVYMHLQRRVLDHREPREVKSYVLGETLRMGPASVIAALNWLVRAGYLIEHPRAARGVRVFTLAWARPAPIATESFPIHSHRAG
jgi:hypothetical protein